MTKYHGTYKNKGNKGHSYNVNVLGWVQVVLAVVVQFKSKNQDMSATENQGEQLE